MSKAKLLPKWTNIEKILSAFRPAKFLIRKIHAQRKKYYMRKSIHKDLECPSDLRNFERKVYSQYGEDGIIEEIFRRIGEGSRFAVEFGIETGRECNTRLLIESKSWSAVLIDGSVQHAVAARSLFTGRPVIVLDRFLTTDNILDIFAEAKVSYEFDLLSVDVDGNDFSLLEKILTRYRPRAIVTEYNGRWLPPVEWIMPYDAQHSWDGTVYFGASLQSFTNLAERNNYKLVACSSTGLNAFFVLAELIGDQFTTANRGADYHYAAPIYNAAGFGHPVLL